MSVLKAAVKPNVRMETNLVGAPSFANWNPRSIFSVLSSDSYASAYPSIRAIANEYKTVRPYAIDSNGKTVQNNDVVNALYHPNKEDSSVAFAEKVAVSTLVHRKTYILVWRREGKGAKPGGNFKSGDRVAGFTFLEYPGITRRDGKSFYKIGTQEFTEDEVLVLPGGVDPHNLYAGYSPSEAVRRWATLDDYIADYQKGFFENGAVPAGQFMITAATTNEYNDIVDKIEERHKGAGKNGNVTFSHRPVDPSNGQPVSAQIEWIPFSQSNKDIDFKNLFEQTNKRIDLAYGVSQIIKGVDDQAKYSNAQVAEKGFAKRAVNPLLLSNYTQITHELNRITNGLGVAITYDYEIPTVADEERVEAETKQIESQIIRDMVAEGYTLDSVVDAFELSNSYKLLKTGNTTSTKINNDKPDVDDGSEVDDSPDPDLIDGITPLQSSNSAGGSKGASLKAELTSLEKLEAATRSFMQSQVDKAVSDYLAETSDDSKNVVTGASTSEQEDKFVQDMLEVIVAVMIAEGTVKYAEGVSMLEAAGASIDNLDEFILSDVAKDNYQAYLHRIGQSYSNDTSQSIRDILSRADQDGLTRAETEKSLRSVMDTDEWRVKRLAGTELNRSQSLSGVEAMKQIQSESGLVIEKALQHNGGDGPCEFCAVLIDYWVVVDQPILVQGETVEGQDGGTYVNSFSANDGYDLHPNGHCSPKYRLKAV